MHALFKDPDLQARFDRDGYVIVDFMPRDEVLALRVRARALLPETPTINDAQEAMYLGSFAEEDRRRAINDFVTRETMPRIQSYLHGQRSFGGTLMVKLPRSPRLPMHAHPPLIADIYRPTTNFWCTLDDVDVGHGALRIVEGSHRISRHIQTFDSLPLHLDFFEQVEERHAKPLPMRAGQAVFFDNTLLHGSEPLDADELQMRIYHAMCPEDRSFVVLKHRGGDRHEAFEVPHSDMHGTVFCGILDDDLVLASAGMVDNRQEEITEEEFAALVASGLKIAPGFDPIDRIRADRAAAEQQPPRLADWALRAMRKVRARVGA